MRAVYVIPLCGLVLVAGLVFAFSRSPTLPVPSGTTLLTSAAPPAPSPPPPRSAQERAPATRATAGLACIQNALGGVRAFAGVSSVRIIGNTKPVASAGMRPVSNNREIRVIFPDRYQRLDVQTGMPPGQAPLTALVGFNGRVLLSQPREPDAAAGMRSAGLEFVREIFMRLPREFADVHLSQRMMSDAAQERLAIDASGPDGVDATLLVDARTCVPVALEYKYRTGLLTVRVDLSEYRRFGGIRFPTVLRTARNGEPWVEEYDSEVHVNAPHADEYFARGGR